MDVRNRLEIIQNIKENRAKVKRRRDVEDQQKFPSFDTNESSIRLLIFPTINNLKQGVHSLHSIHMSQNTSSTTFNHEVEKVMMEHSIRHPPAMTEKVLIQHETLRIKIVQMLELRRRLSLLDKVDLE